MRVLSLRQPWAWVVIHLGKHIENRYWSTSYRGQFLIHASKAMTKKEYYDCLEFCRQVLGHGVMNTFPMMKALPRGCIVGAARLVDVIPPCLEFPCEHRWHMAGQHGLILKDVRPSPIQVPCKGSLGFFSAPPEVVKALQEAALPPLN